jgi:hypothetical protein
MIIVYSILVIIIITIILIIITIIIIVVFNKYNNLFDSKIDLILCFGSVLEVKNADVLINPTGLVDLYLYICR